MNITLTQFLPKSLIRLAEAFPSALYAVGGLVRDFLAGYDVTNGADIDICAPVRGEEFIALAQKSGFKINALYKATGTVKLKDNAGNSFEFSPFRTDKYVRGMHAPIETAFTDDILLDAKRRDFTCNAIYYDIKNEEYVDPLCGMRAVKEKCLTTVAPADKVFGEDGLRLMRLARFTAQTGFAADGECLAGAKKNAALIRDIHPERIWAELAAILTADKKRGFTNAHYRGLKVLDETRVLDYILPELTAGRGMAQRADFHSHDVLEHSLRCAMYCPPDLTLRFAALLHDVGKPERFISTGRFHGHDIAGAEIVEKIAGRLTVPKAIGRRAADLTRLHMYDLSMNTSENKLKRFFIENYELLPDLMALKQADYSACKDDLSPCPANLRWQRLLDEMKRSGAPMRLAELKIKGDDVIALGHEKSYTAKILNALLLKCAVDPRLNDQETLLRLSCGVYRDIKNNETNKKHKTKEEN